MFVTPIQPRRNIIIHLCIISAITVLSSAKFHGWILNQRQKSRYSNANKPFSVSPTYRYPHYQWPFLTSNINYQDHRVLNRPTQVDFNKPKLKSHNRQTIHQKKDKSKPTAAICTKSGYFAYPNDCKKFYRCVATQNLVSEVIFNGSQKFNIFHFVCPAGTIFDERVQVCNHPRVAICNTNNIEGGDNGIVNEEIEDQSQGESFETGNNQGVHLQDSGPVTSSPSQDVENEENDNSSLGGSSGEGSGSNLGASVSSPVTQPTVPMEEWPNNQATSGDSVDADGTSATVIMDGFVIEKPTPESGTDIDSDASASNDNMIKPVIPSLGETSQVPIASASQQDVDTDDNVLPGVTEDHGGGESGQGVQGISTSTSETEGISTSVGDTNVITGADQTISSQIEVTDENKNDGESDGNLPADSISSTVVDGFDVGSSSIGQGNEDDGVSGQTSVDIDESAIDSINDATDEDIENNDSDISSVEIKYEVLPGSLYDCKEPGYYPFESNCIEFYVCLEVLPNVLFAEQLYRCPKRYLFDDVTRRCQKEEKVTCIKPNFNSILSTHAKETVLVVAEQFIDNFFSTSLTYKG